MTMPILHGHHTTRKIGGMSAPLAKTGLRDEEGGAYESSKHFTYQLVYGESTPRLKGQWQQSARGMRTQPLVREALQL